MCTTCVQPFCVKDVCAKAPVFEIVLFKTACARKHLCLKGLECCVEAAASKSKSACVQELLRVMRVKAFIVKRMRARACVCAHKTM